MFRWILHAAINVVCALIPLTAAPLARPYTVENYEVSIRLDLKKQRLYGEAKIRLHGLSDSGISALELDAGQLQVKSVVDGQSAQTFERVRGKLFVLLTNPLRRDEPRNIAVLYEAGPAPGLKFFPDQIYTSATPDWMPCNDYPSERSTFHLTVSAPRETKAGASGQLVATRTSDGQTVTEWQLDAPAGPYWFGFAAGNFDEAASQAKSVNLRVLHAQGAKTDELEPTAAAIQFLADRSGKPFPGQSYTTIFVHGDFTHAFAGGLALVPETSKQELRTLTGTMAHQWYGIAIAPKDWSDLWLTEGLCAFLADKFLGQAGYDGEVDRSRLMYDQLRAGGKDRSLSDNGLMTREEAQTEISEHKGVYFLSLVDRLMGDTAFVNGLRLYTSSQWGQVATSEDLQRAFDATNGGRKAKSKSGSNTLDRLFDLWVYGIANANGK